MNASGGIRMCGAEVRVRSWEILCIWTPVFQPREAEVFNQFGSQWYLEADRTNRVNGTMETQSVHPFVLPLPKRGSVDTPFDEKATCTVLNEKDPAM